MQAQPRKGPVTIKGHWNAMRRVWSAQGITGQPPSLKQTARQLASIHKGTSLERDPVVLDAQRWLQAKRPGGTDEERKARRGKRKEQQSIRLLSKAARKGKGSLKPSGEGKKKKGGKDKGD